MRLNTIITLIDTFEQSPYVAAHCVTIQQHFNNMRRNYSWGTVNELIKFGILAGINVSQTHLSG